MTTLLGASAYGVYVIALLLVTLCRDTADWGTPLYIIHHQASGNDELSSVFWTGTLLGAACAAILVLAASTIAKLYDQPPLEALVQIGSLALIVIPAGQVYAALFEKALRFDAVAKAEVFGCLGSITCFGVLVLVGAGVKAPMGGFVAGYLIRTVFLVRSGRELWRPHWGVSFRYVRRYLLFGLNAASARFLAFVFSRLDQFLLSIYVEPMVLGIYALAWNVTVDPVYRVNPVFSRICFPVFALLQEETTRLRLAYLKSLRVVGAVNAPIVAGVCVTAPVAVPLIFGAEWSPAVPIVQILGLGALARGLSTFTGSTLVYAKGRVDWILAWTAACAVAQAPILFGVAQRCSASDMAIAVSLFSLLAWVLMYPFFVRRLVGPCGNQWLRAFVIPVVCSAVMGFAVFYAEQFLRFSPLVELIAMVALGALVYSILALKVLRPLLADIRRAS